MQKMAGGTSCRMSDERELATYFVESDWCPEGELNPHDR